MPELSDILNELPPELAVDGSTDEDTTTAVADAPADDDAADDTTDTEDTTDDAADDDSADDTDDSADDDYFTNLGDEDADEDKPAATTTPAAGLDNEGQYILTNLPKISVSVLVPGANGEDEVRQVQVYGWGDLPRDMKGFVNPYEQGIFTASANNNELKARELQTEFRQNKVKADTEVYVQRENKMIADDLTELRQEGIFPKFKGVPGSKEFNDSDGAKEFDRVVAYMNEQNDRYGKAAQNGRAFRHIGFREAYIMLNGPNAKADAKREQTARRAVAGKLRTSRGTAAGTRNVSTQPVNNINDLADEFSQFAGRA